MQFIHRKKDGRMSHPLYWTYKAMVKRCSNPNRREYVYYGGRGITVCEKWLGVDGFDNFLSDVGERPKGRTLDRINNDGNYEPSNVRWSTPTEQMRNRRILPSNTSGYTGVSWNSRLGKWRVRIKVDKQEKYIGIYDDMKSAIVARKEAEELYWAILA
jgi:hypothetical protein